MAAGDQLGGAMDSKGGVGEWILDDQSDPPLDENMDLSFKDRKALLNWKFKAGGERIPRFFDKVPHVADLAPPVTELKSEMERLRLCQQIAGEARQAQMEFVYARQQMEMLQQERDLVSVVV
eukprot:GHVU01199000.1.p3 GENE.GHVU01199000.1~~GHVU01199000.1.p3  ORF type:complete len:122 (-),score=28.16 GHVU01199000.1:1579-1944(-)